MLWAGQCDMQPDMSGDKNMIKVYFVRHAESDYRNHDDLNRELTPKGMEDRIMVSDFLSDKNIEAVASSPYKRAVDTMSYFAYRNDLKIEVVDDFRERKIGDEWIDDFDDFAENQWKDFSYKLKDGESLAEVQKRNIDALDLLLKKYEGKNFAVGSHGTALSTIVHYFDSSFDYEDFLKIRDVMPWIVEFNFNENGNCEKIRQYRTDDQLKQVVPLTDYLRIKNPK